MSGVQCCHGASIHPSMDANLQYKQWKYCHICNYVHVYYDYNSSQLQLAYDLKANVNASFLSGSTSVCALNNTRTKFNDWMAENGELCKKQAGGSNLSACPVSCSCTPVLPWTIHTSTNGKIYSTNSGSTAIYVITYMYTMTIPGSSMEVYSPIAPVSKYPWMPHIL